MRGLGPGDPEETVPARLRVMRTYLNGTGVRVAGLSSLDADRHGAHRVLRAVWDGLDCRSGNRPEPPRSEFTQYMRRNT